MPPSQRPVRRLARVLAACLAALVVWGLAPAGHPVATAAPPSGIRLLMVEEPGCRFCRMWDADIGRSYARSAAGRFAPLERVRRSAAVLEGLAPVVYTPTFIVMRRGEEIGRVTGYPGPDYFWTELDPILATAGYAPGL